MLPTRSPSDHAAAAAASALETLNAPSSGSITEALWFPADKVQMLPRDVQLMPVAVTSAGYVMLKVTRRA
jgi:hypothetical protein